METDHILFICSGAFHSSKPSDMMAELQGRLPIRVELKVPLPALLHKSSTYYCCLLSALPMCGVPAPLAYCVGDVM